jgi:transglutaminase-like putative cysteine protease
MKNKIFKINLRIKIKELRENVLSTHTNKNKILHLKKLLLFLIAAFSINAYSQSIYAPLKPVNKSEVKMETYEKDTDAEAVVLFDYGETYFDPTSDGFFLVTKRVVRIKILSESGIRWGKIEIQRYTGENNEETISDIKGTTYNLVNESVVKTRLDKSQIFEEINNKYYNTIKVAMPKVKPGSIVEISYKKTSQSIYDLEDWVFQWEIPVSHSECQVTLTPFYNYKWILQGATEFYSKKSKKSKGLERSIHGISYGEITHNYVMKDIPAFTDTEFITTREDFIMKMDFQLINYTTLNGIKHDVMSSWEKIIREYYMNDSFGKYISKVERKAAKLIDKDRIVGLNEREEVENILKYVKDNYQWNGIHGEMAQSSLTVFLKEKSGNIGNLNLFTIGLLNAVGIEAKGVIMSTRNHGRIYYQYPFTHYFNYVLIYANIDGEHVLLDATNPYLSIWSIPDICINGKGLLIDKKEVEWIPLEDKISSEYVWKFFITMDEKEMSVKVQMRSTGYLGAKLREKINDESFSLYNGLIKSDGIVDESLHVKNKLNAEEPLDVEFDYIGESVNGVDKFYFNPFISIVRNDNPLKEKSRSYPIDFTYPKKYVFESTINIPNGYKFDYYLDDYKKVSNDYIDINYITHLSEGTLSIRFDYHFKKSKYPTSSYNELRSFYDEIVKLGQEKVVLSKTKK